MVKQEIKKLVVEQIIAMWQNNILNENGFEEFVGWLEDGEVFTYDASLTKKDIEEIMDFVHRIQNRVDDLSWILSTDRED